MADPELWRTTSDGCEHVVAIDDAGLRRRLTWTAGGVEVTSRTTSDERVVLDGGDRGAVGVRLPTFVGPARRVTWWGPDAGPGAVAAAHVGVGGLDLEPDAGSRAAEREAWIRAHPRLHTARRTAGAVAGVVLLWLVGQVALPAVPWPDWDLPSAPWPDVDLPAVPWPDVDLPDLDLTAPAWVRTLAGYAEYVWPVLLAMVLARGEVRRRRDQDERKRTEAEVGDGRSGAAGTGSAKPEAGDGIAEAGAGAQADDTARADVPERLRSDEPAPRRRAQSRAGEPPDRLSRRRERTTPPPPAFRRRPFDRRL